MAKKTKDSTINVRVKLETKDLFKLLCDYENVSQSELIERLIHDRGCDLKDNMEYQFYLDSIRKD